jgi:hypothetical protein
MRLISKATHLIVGRTSESIESPRQSGPLRGARVSWKDARRPTTTISAASNRILADTIKRMQFRSQLSASAGPQMSHLAQEVLRNHLRERAELHISPAVPLGWISSPCSISRRPKEAPIRGGGSLLPLVFGDQGAGEVGALLRVHESTVVWLFPTSNVIPALSIAA